MSGKDVLLSRQEKEIIVQKAREDETFKRELLAYPHQAIARAGVNITGDIEIKVLEESARVAYLVLPVNLEELIDEDLDMMSAGICFAYYCPCNTGGGNIGGYS